MVNITLPDRVSVGNTALGSGQYTITEYPQGSVSTFVFREGNGNIAAVVQGQRTASRPDGSRTEVVLSPDDEGILHPDKMFVEGGTTGYQFVDVQ